MSLTRLSVRCAAIVGYPDQFTTDDRNQLVADVAKLEEELLMTKQAVACQKLLLETAEERVAQLRRVAAFGDSAVKELSAGLDAALRERDEALARVATLTPKLQRWQCSGCRFVFEGRWLKTCPSCKREDYWTGSVDPKGILWTPPTASKGEG